MNSAKGRDLHTQAEHAREIEQDFLKALKLTDEATIAYQEDKDYLGLAEVQASRFITLKHLYRQKKENAYLVLAKHTAFSGVELAEKFGPPESQTLPYFNLGKAFEEGKDLLKAKDLFAKALNSPLPGNHNRPAVKADIKAHLAYALYASGDKNGLKLMDEAITELKQSDEFKYNKDAWLSGAHMRAAEMLYKVNKEKSKMHLYEAQKIINNNPDLKLRKQQYEELSSNLLF